MSGNHFGLDLLKKLFLIDRIDNLFTNRLRIELKGARPTTRDRLVYHLHLWRRLLMVVQAARVRALELVSLPSTPAPLPRLTPEAGHNTSRIFKKRICYTILTPLSFHRAC